MGSRGVALISLFALLAISRGAAAESSASRDPRIDTVRVADQAEGSIVSVTLRGRHQPRLLRSVERLVAIVIADVDADGDLDIIASTIRQGLLLWRNAGRGHFVLARLPKARDALGGAARASNDRAASAQDEPGEGIADSAIPHEKRGGDPLAVRSVVDPESFSPLAQSRTAPTGRAPPVRA